MGQEQNKYHITNDGKIFRINDDGSFTELGNAEDLNNSKQQLSNENQPKNKISKSWCIIVSLAIIALIGIAFYSTYTSNFYGNNNVIIVDTTSYEETSVAVDTTSYEETSVAELTVNPDFDEWREHAYNYINELINSREKSHFDSQNYSVTDARINAAIAMFYVDEYANVEELMFYPAYRQNNATAQYLLGCIYSNGEHSITQDEKLAFYWFEQAAKNGHPKAMYYLARDYYHDKANRYYWMQKAADAGDAEAYYFGMAKSYEYGTFTEVDLHKALQLYQNFANDYVYEYEDWGVYEDIKRVKRKLGM